MSYDVQRQCPLCDWAFVEPKVDFNPPARGPVGAPPSIDDLVRASLLWHAEKVEGALREHFASHTAQVMLEG